MSSIVNTNTMSLNVTSLLIKSLENACKDLISESIKECATKYGFDANEAIAELALNRITVNQKQMERRAAAAKAPKAPKEKKDTTPLPFCAELVNHSGCHGLTYNHGLFTQCTKKPVGTTTYCKSCLEQCEKNDNKLPDCGTIEMRLASNEYVDPKGRKSVVFGKVMQKLKLTKEKVLEAAYKLNIELDEAHFVVPETKKGRAKKEKDAESTDSSKKRGRPKKTLLEIVVDDKPDLFASLVQESVEEVSDISDSDSSKKMSDEEKALKKAKKEQERKDREEKKQKEDQEKAAKKEQERKEKEEKKQKEEQEKAAKKALKEKKTEAKEEPKNTEEKKNEKVKVKTITIDGVSYYLTADNTLYNMEREPVGVYNKEKNTIEEFSDDEEESEDEYDE